ncbi:MAG: nickel pincer cofactor biosynthesis protein LarB [Nitrososphaerota archaeon]|jgi:NCAIR mutase (PurE)-related protein|uniref:nickel pincer cofactor biosynthesis protein LarB n=1 Tax=Candidatus Bathycorpusculum sp. TaxID=2994959 RepID=UPI00283361E5|nr:nickel pincer cofactor biosynthesis protein LarB [Candidatus Termitimicrobium sp.]MCL2430986.1 nickel pincer cofactor biosynthesis protein LarB [Candidatus Termitimicrobium sp.]MDR0493695.1 nickel pincer cofactor biosynthesis protein LarB [Nitrososphaerota archaeon]
MQSLKEILDRVFRGELSPVEAEKMLKLFAVDELGCLAKLDGKRELRKGVPEIILAEGKTPLDVAQICGVMLANKGNVIVSRCSLEHLEAIKSLTALDETFVVLVNEQAKMVVIKERVSDAGDGRGRVGILTAGTSDIPVAEEARVIAEEMGCSVFSCYDVGVAGIHRLLEPLKRFIEYDVDVVVVVAGREGALGSVVAGLVDVPVIGVPTSNSYGFGAKGVGALMAMLQSCSLGLAVVNIDGGVAAGAVAALIANRADRFRK